MLAVVDGIARHLDADLTLVRVTIAALALLTGAGVAACTAAWLLDAQAGMTSASGPGSAPA